MLLSQLFTILMTAIIAYYAPVAVHKGNALIAHVTVRAVSLLPKQIEYVDREIEIIERPVIEVIEKPVFRDREIFVTPSNAQMVYLLAQNAFQQLLVPVIWSVLTLDPRYQIGLLSLLLAVVWLARYLLKGRPAQGNQGWFIQIVNTLSPRRHAPADQVAGRRGDHRGVAASHQGNAQAAPVAPAELEPDIPLDKYQPGEDFLDWLHL